MGSSLSRIEHRRDGRSAGEHRAFMACVGSNSKFTLADDFVRAVLRGKLVRMNAQLDRDERVGSTEAQDENVLITSRLRRVSSEEVRVIASTYDLEVVGR